MERSIRFYLNTLGSVNTSVAPYCLPVAPGQLTVVPPAGGGGVAQAAQSDGHLLQGGSLGFTMTGDQLSLEDRARNMGLSHMTQSGYS